MNEIFSDRAMRLRFPKLTEMTLLNQPEVEILEKIKHNLMVLLVDKNL
jgi:hypothetical protein